MKKIIYLLSIILILSCDRSPEYSSSFNFQIKNIDNSPVYINVIKQFELEITDIVNMNEDNAYTISHKVIEGNAIIKNGVEQLIPDSEYILQKDTLNQIGLSLEAVNIGDVKIEFTIKDNNNIVVTKEILFTAEELLVPFALEKVQDFNIKATKQQDFYITLDKVNTSNTYEIRFVSSSSNRIYSANNVLIAQNIWIPLDIVSNGVYNYKYTDVVGINEVIKNDVLVLEVRDNLGQVEKLTYNIEIFSIPQFGQTIAFRRNIKMNGNRYVVDGFIKTSLTPTLSNNATLVQTRISIYNRFTNRIDLIDFNNSNTDNILESPIGYDTAFPSPNSNAAINDCISKSKYFDQDYTIQIKDSDGVWSKSISGNVTYPGN